MTKWDWRYMDEDSLQTYKSAINTLYGREPDEREYYIVNTEAMEKIEEEETPTERMERWMSVIGDISDVPEIPDDIDQYVCDQLELQAEIESDIRRGK